MVNVNQVNGISVTPIVHESGGDDPLVCVGMLGGQELGGANMAMGMISRRELGGCGLLAGLVRGGPEK